MASLTFAEQSGMMGQPGRIKSVEILREQGPKSGELLMHHDDTVAMLREVAAGKRPATLRIYQPNPTVAFGRRDELNPGFTAAAQACRDLGYDILVRKVGGHAAAYHTGCSSSIIFSPPKTQKPATTCVTNSSEKCTPKPCNSSGWMRQSAKSPKNIAPENTPYTPD